MAIESKVYPVEQTFAEKRVAGLASLLQKMGGLELPFDFGSSFENNPQNAYQTAQNILQTVDPYQQGGVGEYLPGFSMDLARERNDPLGEALGLLDAIPAGGAALKGASLFLFARKAELEKLIKAKDITPSLKNSYKKELDEVNNKLNTEQIKFDPIDLQVPAKYRTDKATEEAIASGKIVDIDDFQSKRAKNKADESIEEMNKSMDDLRAWADDQRMRLGLDKPNLSLVPDPPRTIPQTVKSGERTTQNLNLDRPHNRLYHGSNAPGLDRGLGSLNLQGDAGALYMTREKSDPRLTGFANFDKSGTGYGSVYTIKPTFDRTFDTPGVKGYDKPDEMEYIREYLKSKNKNQATRGLLGIKQAITPLKNYRIGTHVPPQVDKEFADFFQDMGYDSLRFRGTNRSLDINPKTGYPYPDQSETIMSLNPEKSLEIMDEMSFSDYLKYLRDPNIPK